MRSLLGGSWSLALAASFLCCGGNSVEAARPGQGSTPVAVATTDAPAPAGPVTLATKRPWVTALALDGPWLYWQTEDGKVERVSAGSGAVATVADYASKGNQRWLAIAGGHVYGARFEGGTSSVLRTKVDGGTPETIGSGPTRHFAFLAADSAHVVWAVIDRSARLAIFVLDAGQTAPRPLPPIEMNAPGTHAVLGPNDVYFCNAGSVYGASLATGTVRPVLALPASDHRIVDFTIAGGRVYAATWEAQGGSETAVRSAEIVSAPLAGGTPSVLFHEGPRNVHGIAADATNVYWVDRSMPNEKGPRLTDGRIMKMPLGGGTPTAVVDHLSSPGFLALGTTALFYSNDDRSSNTSDVITSAK